jgi:hypothetical protein
MYHITDSLFEYIISFSSSPCLSGPAPSHFGDRGGFAHPTLAFSQSTHSRDTHRTIPATSQQNRDQIERITRRNQTRPAPTPHTRDPNQRGNPTTDFSDSTSEPSSQTQSSPSSIQSDRNQSPPPYQTLTLNTPQTPTQPTTSLTDSDDMQEIKMFKGTDCHKQNPQNWLLKLEGSKFKYDTADEHRLYTFSKYLEYGSKAHIWWPRTSSTDNGREASEAIRVEVDRGRGGKES